MELSASVGELKGVGPKTEDLFHRLNIYTAGDLLRYFPVRYQAFPAPCRASQLICGEKNAILLRVPNTPAVNQKSRYKTAVLDITADGEKIRLLWFHIPYIRSMVKKGQAYVFYGKAEIKNNLWVLEQPQIFTPENYEKVQQTLQPVYPLTKGLGNALLQKTIRQCIQEVSLPEDYLSPESRRDLGFCSYSEAVRGIHFPENEEESREAIRRLSFDELFFFVLHMRLSKEKAGEEKNRFVFTGRGYVADWIKCLPYTLTDAQSRALADILGDLHGPSVMLRLLQGDVGSGKTVIAFLAMLYAAKNQTQAALMAPTEVLAVQHYHKLQHFVGICHEDVPVVLLTGSLTAAEKKETLRVIEEAPNALIVGTHALIQEKVVFRELSLVVTDEQHRFGVRQRQTLSDKGLHPHVLVMSATPIPRTLALILYSDLDVSLINEVPKKRLPVKNCVVDTSYRKAAYRLMQEQIDAGHQAYVICPLIEESEGMDAENVMDYAKELKKQINGRIALLHGRLKSNDKNRVMSDFLEHRIDVLVSTTVVEVGMDVPNATVMLIENAEFFGLAQLHQLRGRIGRGDAQSYCIFMHGKDKGEQIPRLEILGHSNDGFAIAQEDLKLRGPGEFFGMRQSGAFSFQVANIYRDAELLKEASHLADIVVKEDPGKNHPEYMRLWNRLEQLQHLYAAEPSL